MKQEAGPFNLKWFKFKVLRTEVKKMSNPVKFVLKLIFWIENWLETELQESIHTYCKACLILIKANYSKIRMNF